MDIDKLKRKRQKNVQEQNILTKDQIYKGASYWRKNGIPIPLKEFLENKGVNPKSSIFIDYQQNFPGMSSDYGTVITKDYEIYEFELDLNKDRTQLIEVTWWEQITDKVEVSNHKKGIKSTKWYLAIEVLNELNKKDQ